MQKEILELETLLEQEIAECSKLEKYITEKKDYLIKGDIENIVNVDIELNKCTIAMKKLEEKKNLIFPNNTLTEIIGRVEEKEKFLHLTGLKEKLKGIALNVQKQNKISEELIKHALKIAHGSILAIVNALVPENASYNNMGKYSQEQPTGTISSVVREV